METTRLALNAPRLAIPLESGQTMTHGIPGGKPVNVRKRNEHQIEQMNGDKVLDMGTIAGDPTVFIVRTFGNVQIDPVRVIAGDFLLLAQKELVLVGSTRYRLIARYDTLRVRMPHQCIEDGLAHTMSICTQCIHGSWTWDYLIRNIRDMPGFVHGENRAYDVFGCRCDFCAEGHKRYMSGERD